MVDKHSLLSHKYSIDPNRKLQHDGVYQANEGGRMKSGFGGTRLSTTTVYAAAVRPCPVQRPLSIHPIHG